MTYLSKILEKAIHIQLNDYLDKNNLFSCYQSGYIKYHSCETAVTRIRNDILLMIDQKGNVLLLLDLSAAFVTIDYSLLLKKLKNVYCITDVAQLYKTNPLMSALKQIFSAHARARSYTIQYLSPGKDMKLPAKVLDLLRNNHYFRFFYLK